ncbi:hypothetical protein FDUTEX481_07833 [Tolypothrix sp. PCC 7601]|nr:hypothetical protein FDUTEX481_07833 [Tolypothrix sp. PCC 7601]
MKCGRGCLEICGVLLTIRRLGHGARGRNPMPYDRKIPPI